MKKLLAAAFAARLAYALFFTEYWRYLTSDMGEYWRRALRHLEGDPTAIGQWVLQAPLFHILLAGFLRAVDFLGLGAYRLEETILLNAALGTAGVWFFHGVARETLGEGRAATGLTALYAFTFPLVYLNAFVMTENLAIPLLLGANYFLFTGRGSVKRLALAGALLGVASGVRPSFLPFALPFAAYAFFSGFPRARRGAAALLAGIALVVSLASAENARISGGRLKGLSCHGGINFFIGKTKASSTWFYHEGHLIRVCPSEYFVQKRPQLCVGHAPYDQGFFYEKGWEELKRNPKLWVENLADLRYYLTGKFFPLRGGARLAGRLVPAFYAFFAALTAFALAFGPLAAFRDRRGRTKILFFLSLFAIVAAEGYVYLPDARYFLPLVAPLYLVSALAARALGTRRRSLLESSVLH